MADFWLDSNVFIEGKKGPYGFDIAPRFWELIDELIEKRRISCPSVVYDELLDGQDDLAEWAKERRTSGVFVEPNASVQQSYIEIVQYVELRYQNNQARRRFMSRADPWVIAHVRALGGAVVTMETMVRSDSSQVKIPNVCDGLSLRCVNTYQMIRELGVQWNA